jgi:hypothetical protein
MRGRVNLRPHFFLGEQEGVSWAFIANKQKGSQTRKNDWEGFSSQNASIPRKYPVKKT